MSSQDAKAEEGAEAEKNVEFEDKTENAESKNEEVNPEESKEEDGATTIGMKSKAQVEPAVYTDFYICDILLVIFGIILVVIILILINIGTPKWKDDNYGRDNYK